ncbi:3-hydroxyacyl-CoA dehydrogenase NAD-binding domain-containing protein [Bosea sp. (in: a-proteobacteria)]|uniref:3-hydroxyacyl-CoA dehydrogenase NAD-binding domain-containing protein n=1 Tax=Bosea sp. (in: a-proteobacteria) TaxID=1871050 RepID=UPI001ACD0683|nr:3-hydroxyacyl-CoA dehydrogenase NAD-binding domain-containing protein [Bosea sp. (in: a-proteobacteria)]MBN9440467.1 3-hydroxyacyl-CoA dehydrogenase [Bosea sp. (in: a-proteobacteria)]
MSETVKRLAIVGAGMIGASWAALASAHGIRVCAYDPNPEAEARFLSYVERARAQLAELGLTGSGAVGFSDDLAASLEGAGFVQENGPENEAVKRRLLAEIDGLLPSEVVIASSTSALVRSAIVADCAQPERIIVAHPFNPPHLVPLVEIVGANPLIVARAAAFYRALGRRPVILNREMPGHIANRLASALYREAVHLVEQGVASVADIDAALCNGPGLRWALMGPHMTYHLGGGEGGIAGYLAHLGPSQVRRWQSLGSPSLDTDVQAKIIAGVAEEAGGRSIAELEARRDEGLLALLKARTLVSE